MNSDRRALAIVPLTLGLTKLVADRRRSQFEAAPVPEGRVVFLGDSITEQGLWDQWLPELPGLNRGIGGNTTQDILDRLDSAINRPVAVSLLVGTNDLHGKKSLRDPRGIVARAERIVTEVRDRAPEATVLINSITPRTVLFAERIRAMNVQYREIAARTGATFVDLWPVFADANGALREEFTRDNLHLKPRGYEAWRTILRPHLKGFAR